MNRRILIGLLAYGCVVLSTIAMVPAQTEAQWPAYAVLTCKHSVIKHCHFGRIRTLEVLCKQNPECPRYKPKRDENE